MQENNKSNIMGTIIDSSNFLFGNSGKKIKIVALIEFVLAAIGTVIYFFQVAEYNGAIGFAILVVGLLGSYVVCLIMTAFGELVENSYIIAGKAPAKTAEGESDELPEL